jgi:hypothetical protein
MKDILREEIEGSKSAEKCLFEAFENSKYKLKECSVGDFQVRNHEAPGQLIVRGNGTVLDEDGEEVFDSNEVYGRILLDEKDEGFVVVV